jgi:hypothetical protein
MGKNMVNNKSKYQKSIEQHTGLSIEQIESMSLEDLRRYFEDKNGKPLKFVNSKNNLITKESVDNLLNFLR